MGALAVALGARPADAGPFTAKGTQPGLAHPILASSACTTCHGNYDSVHDIEPGPTWQGSLMAQSARDPLFWASLDVANHDVPGIGDFCLRCHAPAAWLAGRSEPPGGSTDGCGLLGPIDQPGGDFDGVSCHTCHRLQPNPAPPPGQDPIYLENGQLWLDDGTCDGQGEPCRYGPYDYAAGGLAAAPHVWEYSPYLQSADLCGACHNVTNPALDLVVDGADTGIRFPIERTHREWEQSAYGFPGGVPTAEFRSCQGCHMPDALVDPAYASIFQLNNHTGDMGIHAFAGGNAWVPRVLRDEYPGLGIGVSLDNGAAAARAMLASAATVAVRAGDALRPGHDLAVQVTVTNRSGHKLPTGYPEGRRMWLHVEARDGNGARLFESGAYDAATGVLTRDAQIKAYEAKQGIWNAGTQTCDTDDGGRDLFHFARNDCVALDNRIPPKGFTGGSNLETRPVGYAYDEVAPGVLANVDLTDYAIPIPPDVVAPVTVTATLRYQTTSKEYVDFLLDEATAYAFPDDCIARSGGLPGRSRAAVLHDMWQTHGRAAPETIASASAVVAASDAFLCARSAVTAKSPRFTPISALTLTDAFGGGTADAKKLANLCAPADVGAGILDPSTYLTAFKLKGAIGAPQVGLHVRDRLGTLTVDTRQPSLLLTPTALGAVPPPSGTTAIDDFACYRTRPAKHAPKLPAGLRVAVSSPFAPDRALALKALRLLCVAVDRGSGRQNPAAALTCYAARPAAGAPAMTPVAAQAIASALAALTVDATADALLCLPATIAP
ncbi:hypothetical protein KF840_25675 [bacterium]|nr:hypothetical protein [bacterium]